MWLYRDVWFSTNFLHITVILSLSLHYVRKNPELNLYRVWHSQLSLLIYNVIKYIALPLLGLIQQKIILVMHSYSHTELSLARFPCSPYCSSAGRLLIGQKMRHFDSASRRNFPVVEQTIGLLGAQFLGLARQDIWKKNLSALRLSEYLWKVFTLFIL